MASQQTFSLERIISLASDSIAGEDVKLEPYIELWEEFFRGLQKYSSLVELGWNAVNERLDVLKLRRRHCTDRNAYNTVGSLLAFEAGPGPFAPASIFFEDQRHEGTLCVDGLQHGVLLLILLADAWKAKKDFKTALEEALEATVLKYSPWMTQSLVKAVLQIIPPGTSFDFVIETTGIDIRELTERGTIDNVRTIHSNIKTLLASYGRH